MVGALIGYLTGIVASTGPINVPFFLAYGLIKGAFLGTEAMSSLLVYVSKSIVFRSFGALPAEAISEGLIIGASLMAGSVYRQALCAGNGPGALSPMLMDVLLFAAGLTMLWSALK